MLIIKPYNRRNAYTYAARWALDRNPLFFNFNGIGGDCTNFVSQCLFAGGCVMNYTPTYGWYYISSTDRTPSWAGVEYFYDFIVNNRDAGPFATETTRDRMQVGDVVQVAKEDGDYYHTMIITGFANGEILVSAHSDDYFNRTLSSYNYTYIRYLHIGGIRMRTDITDTCFEVLLAGGINPVTEESNESGEAS